MGDTLVPREAQLGVQEASITLALEATRTMRMATAEQGTTTKPLQCVVRECFISSE